MAVPSVRPTPATSTVASLALAGTRGAHATLRLDNFLRSTDSGYQHAEGAIQGDRFLRKMATCGQVRPSWSFTNQSRVERPLDYFHGELSAVDMSTLPGPGLDPKGNLHEGCLDQLYPPPPKEIDTEFIELFNNHKLMLPSERYKEHLRMRSSEKKWHEDRETVWNANRRLNHLKNFYPHGVVGIDGPTFHGTQLYAQERDHFVAEEARKAGRVDDRHAQLTAWNFADDVVACRNYGAPPLTERNARDVRNKTRRVDNSDSGRFMDTTARIFPTCQRPWDPGRAMALRSHELRENKHHIIHGGANDVSFGTLRLEPATEFPSLKMPLSAR